MTKRLCSYYGCKAIALPDTHRCSEHPPKPMKKRNHDWHYYNGRHIYKSAWWRKLRMWKLTREPLCEHCLVHGITREATVVDHIEEIRHGGDPRDPENLQSLCHACHNRKTAQVAKEYRKKKRLEGRKSMSDFKSYNGFSEGDVLSSRNYGDYEITELESHARIKIRFLLTGFETITTSTKLKTGAIKDPYFPKVYGVGYYGEGECKASKGCTPTVEYNRWYGILERCYSGNYPDYDDCEMHPDWHNFQVFAQWFRENKPDVDDISEYDIDKDIKVKGNRVYGPDTCSIVHHTINKKEAHANKCRYLIEHVSGGRFIVVNVTEFANLMGLQATLLWKVIKGKRNVHKGFRFVMKID